MPDREDHYLDNPDVPATYDPAGPPFMGMVLIALVVIAVAGGLMWLLGGTPRVWH